MDPLTQYFNLFDAPATPHVVLSKAESKKTLKSIQKQIRVYHERLQAEKRNSLLCVFQAMDAAGKDGTIRAVFTGLNPAGIQVNAFGRPTTEELGRDYLWRIHQCIPPKGQIGIFNRSHYEEVVTVRVFPEFLNAQSLPRFELNSLMNQRLEEIKAFEERLAKTGIRILKFFLNVSLSEQKKRLLSRMETPEKHWKHDGHDLNCREKWFDFMNAYQTAIQKTTSQMAPWYCVPADHKPTMRVMVAQKILETLTEINPQFPTVNGTTLQEIKMDKERLLSMDNS